MERLYAATNFLDGLRADVWRNGPKKFSVIITDTDANESFPTIKIFENAADAIAHANILGNSIKA